MQNNRIIKFRAWDAGRMLMLYECERAKPLQFYMDRIKANNNGSCLMQFTGLVDKNGTDIYEGDLVRKDTYNIGYCLPIIWRDCMFQIGIDGISPIYNETQFEVIGNIYENPELLK
jgi:hypothetical protein